MSQLDLILPCFNPQPGWAEVVCEEWKAISRELGFEPGLILVNDGSTEGIKEKQLTFLSSEIPTFQYIVYSPNRGKGYALREGVKASSAERCIYTDIDFPYTRESLLKIYQRLQDGLEVAPGVKDADYYKNVPVMRQRISKLLRWMIRRLFNMKIADTQCGLKGFSQEGRTVFLGCEIERYLFDLEFLYKASRKDLKMEPIEIHLRDGVVFSKMKPGVLLREGFNFLKIRFGGLASFFF